MSWGRRGHRLCQPRGALASAVSRAAPRPERPLPQPYESWLGPFSRPCRDCCRNVGSGGPASSRPALKGRDQPPSGWWESLPSSGPSKPLTVFPQISRACSGSGGDPVFRMHTAGVQGCFTPCPGSEGPPSFGGTLLESEGTSHSIQAVRGTPRLPDAQCWNLGVPWAPCSGRAMSFPAAPEGAAVSTP